MDPNQEVLLCDGLNEIFAEMLMDLLDYANIPAIKKIPGAGALYDSQRLLGVEVYVRQQDYPQAQEILDDMFADGENDFDPMDFYDFF